MIKPSKSRNRKTIDDTSSATATGFSTSHNNQFMQNKPNLPDTQMNASYFKTKNYEQNTMEAKSAKQSQNKPNQSQFSVHRQ